MPTFDRSGRAEAVLDISPEEEREGAPEPDATLRILILGDFSGRESRGVHDPASLGFDRNPVRVDRDDLDEVIERLGVEIRLSPAGGPAISIRARSLEDFHPDRLFERQHAFHSFRETREDLENVSTFDEAAARVRSWGLSSPEAERPEEKRDDQPREEAGDLMEGLLRGARRPEGSSKDPAFDAFLKEIVRPHVAPAEHSEKGRLLSIVDGAVGLWMRSILHDPAFQAVEAAWRGLDFLLRRIESDTAISVFLLDVTRQEIAEDVKRAKDLSQSGLHRILVERTVETMGAEPWGVLAGVYPFAPTVDDVALLARLSRLAAEARAPFLAAAGPALLACESLERPPDRRAWERAAGTAPEELWAALRGLPEARYVGLASPRFLLRLPYGPETSPTDLFEFREAGDRPAHEEYLWGNPSFFCAAALAESFSRRGLVPPTVAAIAGLPLHVFRQDGENRVQPCAETILPLPVAEAMLERGVMPLVSMPDRDAVALARFQSIASPPSPLAGRWS